VFHVVHSRYAVMPAPRRSRHSGKVTARLRCIHA
jgi:hypothetical protein